MTQTENDFQQILIDRIQQLRKSIKLNPKTQKPGYRFKNDKYLKDGIMGAVIASNKIESHDIGTKEAIGLAFETVYIESGSYDLIIKKVLSTSAFLDFLTETNLDYH